jgi:signal transduction histidine kinase/CheY-like chemotaxis protein
MLQTARIAPFPLGNDVVGTITVIEDVTQREFQASNLRRQQEIDHLLSTALASLLQSSDPVEETSAIYSTISPVLGLDAFVSYVMNASGGQMHLNASGGIAPKHRAAFENLTISDADEAALRSGVPPEISRVATYLEGLRLIGLNGLWTFPLIVADRIIGLVTFGSYQNTAISSANVSVLARITRYVAIALDRASRQKDTLAASRAKDDFLAALSHELRTPLNPVLLLASDCAANPEYSLVVREAFRMIEKNALLEARLIDDLLDLTRIEHGKLSLEIAPVDVHSAIRDALTTIRPDAAERNLTIDVNLAAEESILRGDFARLQQVFWNILKNSVKFTPVGGQISISSCFQPGSNEIMIEIRDTGIGMAEHEVIKVFGAFSQGDHALHRGSHRFGGLGLGLAIAHKLIVMHAGRIVAASGGKEQGSTFTVFLPLIPVPVREPSPSVTPSPSSARDAPSPPVTRRILLVEDHEPTRAPLVRLLARRGYEVISAGTAAAALDEAAKNHFDLVLSDIGLPDRDGFDLMRELRDLYGMRGIALTGYGMEDDVDRSGKSGFIAHLTKPISVAILDRALTAALTHSPST